MKKRAIISVNKLPFVLSLDDKVLLFADAYTSISVTTFSSCPGRGSSLTNRV